MLETLKIFNYTPPNINIIEDEYLQKFGPTGPNSIFKIVNENNVYRLLVKGEQWMMYNNNDHMQGAQLFAHYYIANGDVLATGLGFAIRECWLLNNQKIKSLTILEKNQHIIDYQKKANPLLFEKTNIICCDVKDYKSNKIYDTLLLDHYEFETMGDIIDDVKTTCNNIKCKKLWFWHLETQILADLHNRPEQWICEDFRSDRFKIDIETLKNIKPVYDNIKNVYGLDKLPNLTADELQLILTIYTLFFQKM